MGLQQVASANNSQLVINELFETLGWSGIFGKRHPVTTGLIWGYYGGRYGGTLIADGTLTLAANAVNEIVVDRGTGSVMLASGSPSEWEDTANYARLYRVTTNSSVVTAAEDHRLGAGGLFGATGDGVSNAATATALQTARNIDGVSFDGTADIAVIAPATHAAASKTTPVDADELPLVDSADSNALKRLTWANLKAAMRVTESLVIAVSDESTALTSGTGKVTFRMPYGFTLTEVRASLTVAQASGSTLTVDLNEGGTTVLSTKVTIDNTEKTSTTAATAAVISDATLADDAEMTIDIDQVGDGTAKGLKVYLIGRRT